MDTRNFFRRAIIGTLLISAGLLLLGFNLGILPIELRAYFFTPKILLVIFGIVFITKRHHFFFGAILLFLAFLLYFPLITNIQVDFTKVFWPALLILGGIQVIIHRHHKRRCYPNRLRHKHWYKYHAADYSDESYKKKHDIWADAKFEKTEVHDNFIEDVLFFSGNEKVIDSKQFEGGKIVSFFGGLKVDLTKAELAPGVNGLELIIGFGGCKLIVPSHWNVRVDAVSIFGGFVDKRIIISSENSDKTLIIKGVAIFGGGEITSI